MSEPYIQIHNLHKTYDTSAGPLSVLVDINWNFECGEFAVLVGPSGSGKTTFLNMLTGIDTPTRGQIIINGFDITQSTPARLTQWRARQIGIVFQFCQLLPTLTVVNNVMAPMYLANVWPRHQRRDIALKLLQRFGIGDQADKRPDMLSGGQQQRVGLARALANNPPLVVADEPTANLDRVSARRVFETFRELTTQGYTVIVVTHDRELIREVPTILQIYEGRLERTSYDAIAKYRTNELQALPPSAAH
jgi:putative ABC transport system ATP-binding protein